MADDLKRTCTWLYLVLRKELVHEAAMIQASHAARECSFAFIHHPEDGAGKRVTSPPSPTEDERCVILAASVDEMRQLREHLTNARIPFKACIETDGDLAKMADACPSIGFAVTAEVQATTIEPMVGEAGVLPLKKFKFPRPSVDSVYEHLRKMEPNDRWKFLADLNRKLEKLKTKESAA